MNTINLQCPITSKTGYGITSYNIFRGLLAAQYNVHLFPIGASDVDSEAEKQLFIDTVKKSGMSWSKKDPCLKIWHQFDLSTRIGSGKYGGLIFFETTKLNDVEVNMINNLDVVFVATQWAKTILEQNNISVPVVVSPLAVNTDVFRPVNDINKKNDKYVFINVGKWEIRKGHDFLVDAFNSAFSETDNVELWMINHNIFLSQEENNIWADMYRNSKLGSKIKILPRATTHKELAAIMNLADCGIFPARAEGWNNEILEIMALNKPIIATNYSAHTEYCNHDNSYLIDIDKMVTARDNKFFNGSGGEWADLGHNQLEQTVSFMKKVYLDNIRSNPNGLNTAKQYSWLKTAQILAGELCDANSI